MSQSYEHINILYQVGKKERFKLLRLPVLARNEVVRSMDINEIIKLSLSSRKMAGIVRYSKVRVENIEIHSNINSSMLQIKSFNKNLYKCSPDHQREEGSYILGPNNLSRWIDKNSSSFQNCVSIFKYLQNIILFEELCLHVNFEGMTVELFKEILTKPAIKDFAFLCLDKGEIDAECLNMAMETATARRKRDLYIIGTKVPESYYHENAFKFNDVAYCDAKWVRIQHLLNSKDSFAFTLKIHSLTGSDVNTFIKFWIDNDHDMVRVLRLDRTETFQPAILFDGIVVLVGRRKNIPFFLIAANTTKQRKYQIMIVFFERKRIEMFSWGKDQPIVWGNFVAEAFEPEYKVLLILNRKKELEEELERIQNLLETNQDQNMIEKKNYLLRELQKVSAEIDSYNLVFRNGTHIYTEAQQ